MILAILSNARFWPIADGQYGSGYPAVAFIATVSFVRRSKDAMYDGVEHGDGWCQHSGECLLRARWHVGVPKSIEVRRS